jgi:peptidoglycan hydrolase CwlO-like protein
MQAARQTEIQRLEQERLDAIEQAQSSRLGLLDQDRQALEASAKKVEKQIRQLDASLTELWTTANRLDRRRKEESAVPFATEHLTREATNRVQALVNANSRPQNADRLEHLVPSMEAISDRSWWPQSLDDFETANSV